MNREINRMVKRRAIGLACRMRADMKAAAEKPWEPFQWLPPSPATPAWCVKAAMNNVYIVMFHEPQQTEWGEVQRMLIQLNTGEAQHNWQHFQRIKNELCGPERMAIEIYPPAEELVDEKNVYHLWLLPAGYELPFGFRKAEERT